MTQTVVLNSNPSDHIFRKQSVGNTTYLIPNAMQVVLYPPENVEGLYCWYKDPKAGMTCSKIKEILPGQFLLLENKRILARRNVIVFGKKIK